MSYDGCVLIISLAYSIGLRWMLSVQVPLSFIAFIRIWNFGYFFLYFSLFCLFCVRSTFSVVRAHSFRFQFMARIDVVLVLIIDTPPSNISHFRFDQSHLHIQSIFFCQHFFSVPCFRTSFVLVDSISFNYYIIKITPVSLPLISLNIFVVFFLFRIYDDSNIEHSDGQ